MKSEESDEKQVPTVIVPSRRFSERSVERTFVWLNRPIKSLTPRDESKDILARTIALITVVVSLINLWLLWTESDYNAENFSRQEIEKARALLADPGEEYFLTERPVQTFADRERLEKGYSILQALLDIDARHSEALALTGTYFLKRGLPEDAKKYFYETLIIDENNLMALHGLGRIYSRENDLVEAEEYFKRAISARPDFAAPYVSWASLFIRQGKLEEAQVILEAGILKDPAFPPLYIDLGAVFYKKGEFLFAQKVLEQAIIVDPYSEPAFRNLIATLIRQGNFIRAEHFLRVAESRGVRISKRQKAEIERSLAMQP